GPTGSPSPLVGEGQGEGPRAAARNDFAFRFPECLPLTGSSAPAGAGPLTLSLSHKGRGDSAELTSSNNNPTGGCHADPSAECRQCERDRRQLRYRAERGGCGVVRGAAEGGGGVL